jgi:hypothetical protein
VVAGAGAVVLGILGLAGVLPFYMLTIGAICAGTALFLEGSAIASQYNELEKEMNATAKTHIVLGGGMSFEVIGGLAGICLGILALVGVAPMILVDIASIAMGGGLFLGAGSVERLDKVRTTWYSMNEPMVNWMHGSILGAAGLQVLVGLGVAALGIIALVGYVPMLLNLIAMISIGGSVLLSGAAIGGKMAMAVKHENE